MAILSEIDLVASRLSVSSLSMLPADHDLHQYIRKLLALLVAEQQQQQQAGSAQPESATLLIAKQVFLPLFAAIELPLRFELHLYLLEGVQAVCSRLRKELTSWLLYLDDEVRRRRRRRRHHHHHSYSLLRPHSAFACGCSSPPFARPNYPLALSYFSH